MPTHTAACFDLDGTLIDTEPVHLQAEISCLASLGIGENSLRHARTFGRGIQAGVRSLAETYDLDCEQVLSAYMPLWKSGLRQDLRALPGAIGVLAWLREHGVPTALVTSGDRAYVDLVDSVLGLAGGLIAVVTSDDATNLKPAPDPYLKAAHGLAASPDMCVGFEDSGSGVAALNRAGMLSVAVHPDHGARPELQVARVRARTLIEVLPLLPAWFE